MKHAQVKGKTIKMVRSQVKSDEFISNLIETHKKQLQPAYFDQENKVESRVEGDKLIHTIKNAVFYTMPDEKLPAFLKTSGQHSTEFIEKINRNEHKVESVEIIFDIDQTVESPREVQVTFRKGGDFIFNSEGDGTIYGQNLKASNFVESGFETVMLNGVKNLYTIYN